MLKPEPLFAYSGNKIVFRNVHVFDAGTVKS